MVGAVDPTRTILHVDMDAFFAAIEQLDNPELRRKPILVGYDGPRGVVTTASYEARPYGCRSAMPMAVAKRLCPQAIVVPVRGKRYREFSQGLMHILESFSPLVQPISIDEAFVDLTGTERLFGSGERVAREIRQRIRTELQLTGSIGVAPNKFLAKLASDLDKPDGLTVITPDNVDAILYPLPINRVWGIGPRTAARLEAMNLRTIGDLRRMDNRWFSDTFGEDGPRFRDLCFGIDRREVTPDHQAKSIGHELTFDTDLGDSEALRGVLMSEVEQVGWRLRRAGLFAHGVRLKIRYGDFKTISRSTMLDAPTDSTDILWRTSLAIFDKWASQSFQPVRLLGMTAAPLGEPASQLSLFDQPQSDRRRALDLTLDQINSRFGKTTIHRARRMKDEGEA